jgi:uncharacterized ferritin-like protein (DUF455 family)
MMGANVSNDRWEKRVKSVQDALNTTREDAEKVVAIADRRYEQTGADILPVMIQMLAQGDWKETVRKWAKVWKEVHE